MNRWTMIRTGSATLPLHFGKAPPWLINKMKELGSAIFSALIEEYDELEVLRRLSDPYWFQCLSCVLGFDWHSSGTTTVTMGVIKSFLNPAEHRLAVVGGKGAKSRLAQTEIEGLADSLDIPSNRIEELKKISRLTAKVDNAALQDGFQLYHHTMIIGEKAWAVVQQGMDNVNLYARRYHWLSTGLKSLVVEPHTAIISDIFKGSVLDMTARDSGECRAASLDLIKDNPKNLKPVFMRLKDSEQTTLTEPYKINTPNLTMPRRLDWVALQKAYEIQPSSYEELLLVPGIGAAAVRALALISDLLWGAPPSWRDPAKFSFAHGGKDGVPYPVDRRMMEKSTIILRSAVEEAKIGRKDKLMALKRITSFTNWVCSEYPTKSRRAK